MTNVVILNGASRMKGNTSVLVDWAVEELEGLEAEPKRYNLYNMEFKGCMHCDACKKVTDAPGCVLQDDLQSVLASIVESDVVIFASPVYCWKISGCLSAALDRFYALFKSDHSLIRDKKVIGLFSAGGGENDGLDLCIEMLQRLCSYSGANYLGTLSALNCTSGSPVAERAELRQELKKVLTTAI